MPNWIEGTVKFRGKWDDIRNFLNKGINAYEEGLRPIVKGTAVYDDDGNVIGGKLVDALIPRDKWIEIQDHVDKDKRRWCTIKLLDDKWVYVEETSRAFVHGNGDITNYMVMEENKEDKHIICFNVSQAWGFEPEDWMNISEKYHLDIRLYGIEGGMGFGQEIEIIQGNLTLNTAFDYDDFGWECPFPWMGG